jgi:PBSX family phage terminase large subunit
MDDFLAELASSLSAAAKKPNVLSYSPNSPIHQNFHESTMVGRILKGGNRSGKSVAGTVESVWRATGRHPFYSTHDVPTRGRIVTVDKDAGILQIIIPLLKQWIPPSELINGSWDASYKASGKVLTLRNGSTIELKTHQQETESFAGVPLHWCWFDEEPPQAIFNECRLRLIDYNGCWYMTMTPVEGQDWIYDRFISAANKNVDVFEVNIEDNPHLNKEALALLDEDLSDDEKKIRQKGIFVPKGGLVLKEFDYNRHVIGAKGTIPESWAIYVSIDHGYNAPTAILWHAVSPNNDVVTCREIYRSKTVIKDLVDMIKLINAEIGREPTIYMGDPSMSQKNAITGTSALSEYRRHGIPLMQAKKDVAGRINKMNEYLKYDKWHITEQCPNTIKEARGYSYKIYNSPRIADRNNAREEPNKKNDHAMDSSGYFFNFMPYINADAKMQSVKTKSSTLTNGQDFPWEVDSAFVYSNSSDVLQSGGEQWEVW